MTIGRLFANIVLGLVAIFLIIASLVFSAGVAGWLMFSVALGVVALTGVAQLDRRARLAEHAIDGATGTLAIWATVASVVFAGATVSWLSFAEAIGFVLLAFAGIAAATQRLVSERAARKLGAAPSETSRPAEAFRPAA
jgi:hypothetical protein